MAFVSPKDRVLETSSTAGTGPYALAGAVDASFNRFAASMSVGDTTIGAIVEPGVAFATGVLTYSAANQITLSTTFESKGTFGSGTKEIFMGQPASRAAFDNIDLAGVDLNTVITAGQYACDAACSNRPPGITGSGYLQVFITPQNGGYQTQIFTTAELAAEQIWVRCRRTSSWDAWQQLEIRQNQNANKVYAGPASGSDALSAFRALVAADLPAASDSAQGALQIATTADMKAAASTTKAVTPGRLKWHPGILKVGGLFDSAAGAGWTWGVASSSKPGTGYIDVVFATAFSGATLASIVASGYGSSPNVAFNCGIASASSVRMHCVTTNSGALTDPQFFTVHGAGDIGT